MKSCKIIKGDTSEVSSIELEDFSKFEEMVSRIRCLKKVKQNLDKSYFIQAIDELELKGKKIKPKRLKKVFKKVLVKMIEEVES